MLTGRDPSSADIQDTKDITINEEVLRLGKRGSGSGSGSGSGRVLFLLTSCLTLLCISTSIFYCDYAVYLAYCPVI